MNSFKPIGGFFEVEPRGTGSMHDETIKMNSARSCFEYLLLYKFRMGRSAISFLDFSGRGTVLYYLAGYNSFHS